MLNETSNDIIPHVCFNKCAEYIICTDYEIKHLKSTIFEFLNFQLFFRQPDLMLLNI